MAVDSSHRRRAPRGVLPVALLVVLFLIAVSVYAVSVLRKSEEPVLVERCTASVPGAVYSLSPDRASVAALISAIAVRRDLPPRAASIAIATAIQESGLRNLDYGDDAGPDSRGLFQQRPSQGWGTQEQVMDPVYAINTFYDALVKVPGYLDLPLTVAAQTVQRSAFPDAYAAHEPQARAFASALTGQSAAALTCTLRPPEASGDPEAVLAALAAAYGTVDITGNDTGDNTGDNAGGNDNTAGARLTVAGSGTYGWSVAQWAVANADALSIDSVAHAGRRWTRATGTWDPASAVDTEVVLTVYRTAGQS